MRADALPRLDTAPFERIVAVIRDKVRKAKLPLPDETYVNSALTQVGFLRTYACRIASDQTASKSVRRRGTPLRTLSSEPC